MIARRLELATRRGELTAQIAAQRDALAAHSWPLEKALRVGDRALDGVDWLKAHPAAVAAGVAALVASRPRRLWSLARKGFVLWRGWRNLRGKLF